MDSIGESIFEKDVTEALGFSTDNMSNVANDDEMGVLSHLCLMNLFERTQNLYTSASIQKLYLKGNLVF